MPDVFSVEGKDVGYVKEVKLKRNDDGWFAPWFVEWVRSFSEGDYVSTLFC